MPRYVAIGHITVDRAPEGLRVGGSAAYAAWTARRLGLAAGIVTVAGEELDWRRCLPEVEIVRVPVASTTSFLNIYESGHRVQTILAVAHPVPPDAVPMEWRHAAIVHFAPVDHEVGGAFPELFPGALIGLTPQGFLREWDRSGHVKAGRWAGDDGLLAGARVAIVSEEDLAGDPTFLSRCVDRVPITVLTQGARGATLFANGESRPFPAFPTQEVDPTGAGDVFAAAFLVEYQRTGDPDRSALFASCAASLSVERTGLEGIPDRSSVEQRLDIYGQHSALR